MQNLQGGCYSSYNLLWDIWLHLHIAYVVDTLRYKNNKRTIERRLRNFKTLYWFMTWYKTVQIISNFVETPHSSYADEPWSNFHIWVTFCLTLSTPFATATRYRQRGISLKRVFNSFVARAIWIIPPKEAKLLFQK